jgi:peptidoglycan hydrolase-like protein with peptidoglycan-binding domain
MIGFIIITVSLLSITSVFRSLRRFRSIIRIHTLIPIPPATVHIDIAQVMAVTEWNRSLCKYNADSRAPDITPALVDGIIGSGTLRAIRADERSHGLPADGMIHRRLLATTGLA